MNEQRLIDKRADHHTAHAMRALLLPLSKSVNPMSGLVKSVPLIGRNRPLVGSASGSVNYRVAFRQDGEFRQRMASCAIGPPARIGGIGWQRQERAGERRQPAAIRTGFLTGATMSDTHEDYEFPHRVWEPTEHGWRSREATPADRAERRNKAREWSEREPDHE